MRVCFIVIRGGLATSLGYPLLDALCGTRLDCDWREQVQSVWSAYSVSDVIPADGCEDMEPA